MNHASANATIVLKRWLTAFGVLVALLLASAHARAGSITLAWDPATSPGVAGYQLYYGPSAGNYPTKVDVGNVTSFTVNNLVEGSTYHFAATAYDGSRVESGFSNDAGAVVPFGKPVANFSASTTSGVAPLAMNFSNSSTGNVTTYAWTFGDGTTSTAQNPSHVYSTAGTFSVSLSATGPGGSSTLTKSNYITVSAAATAPVAAFSANPTSGPAPVTVNFTSSSTGSVSSYLWTFGDGTTSSVQNPSHVYSAAGTYSVSLQVTGPGGTNTQTKAGYVTVTPPAATAPVAAFSANPTSGVAPVTVNFTNSSTGSISSYLWTFGDGTTSTAQTPSHVYSTAGTYSVSLEISGPGGSNTKTISNYVTVSAPPVSTPATNAACPCSIFSSGSAPLATTTDTRPVEVGVKFTSDKTGSITGLRFYKTPGNTGTHIGSLWSSTGRLLARATFSSETDSGWQTVTFSSPVRIRARIVYVASYHADTGLHANDWNYFTAPVDNGPLHALRDGANGGNGVYSIASTPTFPTSTYKSTNYWVDVIFSSAK